MASDGARPSPAEPASKRGASRNAGHHKYEVILQVKTGHHFWKVEQHAGTVHTIG